MLKGDDYNEANPWLTASDPWAVPTAPAQTDPWAAPDVSPAPAADVGASAPWTSEPMPRADDYTADLGPQTSAGGVPPSADAAAGTYDAHLQAVQSATDPAAAAAAHDALARQVQSDLEADGHTVAWKGDNLMIDGRAYELASGGGASSAAATSAESPWQPAAAAAAPASAGAASTAVTPAETTAAQQFFQNFITTNHIESWGTADDGVRTYQSLRDQGQSHAQALQGTITALGWDKAVAPPAQTGAQPWTEQRLADYFASRGKQPFPTSIATWMGYWNDWGKNDPAYFEQRLSQAEEFGAAGGPGPGPSGGGDYDFNQARANIERAINRPVTDAEIAEMFQKYGGNPSSRFTDAGLAPVIADLKGRTPPGGTTGPGSNPYGNWTPSAPGYLPDFIDPNASELPNFYDIYDQLMAKGALDDETESLVRKVLQNPESLSDNDVEMLKAKAAEEAGAAAQMQDEELQHFGANTGLDTSPWLAGQRANNAWGARTATINANRNIDIAAASTRASDRLNAAQLGTSYTNMKAGQKAQAVQVAVTAALGKAAEQRGRQALNESLKQAATQLGLTKDQLVMTYLNHAMDDITKNKSIDLDFQVNMDKLKEQSDEFKQTLLQRIHEMEIQDAQFKANYGLAVQEFQHRKDTDAWEQAKSTYGLS